MDDVSVVILDTPRDALIVVVLPDVSIGIDVKMVSTAIPSECVFPVFFVARISVEAGNGNDYSQAQIDAREWLTRKIMGDLNIPASKVKGHWEIYNNSSCPGYTKAQMDAFRAKLAKPAGSTVAAAPVQVAPAPTPKPASKWVSESGTFVPDFAINVRSAPNTSAGIVATYNKGQSVRYDSYYNDGRYVWIHYKSYSGHDRYMVCRENGKAWGSFS